MTSVAKRQFQLYIETFELGKFSKSRDIWSSAALAINTNGQDCSECIEQESGLQDFSKHSSF